MRSLSYSHGRVQLTGGFSGWRGAKQESDGFDIIKGMFTQGRVRVIALWLADMLCVAAIWMLVVWGYRALGIGRYTLAAYLEFWPVALLFSGFNAAFDLYHGNWMYPAAPLPPVEEMRRLFASSLLTHGGVLAYLAFAYQTTEGVSRVVIVMSGLLVAICAQSFRNWTRRILFKLGVGQIPVVLAGGGRLAGNVIDAISDDVYLGFRIVGRFAEAGAGIEPKFSEIPVLGTLRDIVPEARKRDIKILIACQDLRLFRRQMDEFTGWFTYIEFVPTSEAFPIFGAKAISLDGIGGIEMTNQVRMKARRWQKRTLDMVLSSFAFLVFLPFFVVIPILIKLTSRGSVFYRQSRLGKGGRSIQVWKFRSMYADAEERLVNLLESDEAAAEEWRRSFKLTNDPRVTAFGRFLRKTSLDELPQLINVFLGDMALIGPRPIVKDEIPYYGRSYEIFSSVKPGITGLWQVSGRSGTDYARRVALDTYYVLNWSPWMDIWILIRTVYAVLFMRGAC